MDDKVAREVVTAIIVFNKKILLLLRDHTPGIKDPGCWQLPGGGVEDDESLDTAIKRELEEEIGISPQTLHFLASPDANIHVYHANLSEKEVTQIKKGTEGSDLRFFSLEEMLTIPLTNKLEQAIKYRGDIFRSFLS